MKCPKCDYVRQPRDNQFVPATECPSCGIVYAKSGVVPVPESGQAGGSAIKKPSPVDEKSLKKARERVEKRLRKQLETKVQDERHSLTLERARRIATLEAKKKQPQSEDIIRQANDAAEDSTTPSADTPIVKRTAAAMETKAQAQIGPTVDHDDQPAENPSTSIEAQDAEAVLDLVDIAAIPQATAAAPEESHPAEEQEDPGRTVELKETSDQSGAELHTQRNAMEEPMQEKQVPPPIESEAVPPEVPGQAESDPISLLDQMTEPARPSGYSRLLSLVAWLILFAGLIGAFLSWTTIKDVQAGMRQATGAFDAMPLGLLLGFAYLATGVLGFAFFWVASLISHQLKDIRQILMSLHTLSRH